MPSTICIMAATSELKDETLMEAVQRYGCFYDKRSKYYRDARKILNAWQLVASELCISTTEAQVRHYSLRARLARYLKSIRDVRSGSGGGDVPIKEEYEHMRWFLSHIKHRATASNDSAASNDIFLLS